MLEPRRPTPAAGRKTKSVRLEAQSTATLRRTRRRQRISRAPTDPATRIRGLTRAREIVSRGLWILAFVATLTLLSLGISQLLG